MKKNVLTILIVSVAVILISWGSVGHKTVAAIAEAHLSSVAKNSIRAMLGDQTIGDIAS